MARTVLLVALLAVSPAAVSAQDPVAPGIYAHSGVAPVELLAYAERQRDSRVRLAEASLEDVPTFERLYRVIANMPTWRATGMWAATEAIFRDEFSERRRLITAFQPLNVYAMGLRAAEVETVEGAANIRRSLKATEDNPAYVFISVQSGAGVMREYMVRLGPPSDQ